LPPDLKQRREAAINPETAAMDKGYDNGPLYDACAERMSCPWFRCATRQRSSAAITTVL
jgi:hypothetical protein